MKLIAKGKLPDTSRNIMRRLGYGEHYDHNTQLFSYSRRLGNDRYPRYHAYVDDFDGGISINLHIDQKQASYEGSRAHSGEYEGPLVQEEVQRIQTEISRM